jgi:hypothetical protein
VHIARLEATRKFPLHIDLGENTIAWFEDELDDLLEMKAAERDAKARTLANLEDGPTTDAAAAERDEGCAAATVALPTTPPPDDRSSRDPGFRDTPPPVDDNRRVP